MHAYAWNAYTVRETAYRTKLRSAENSAKGDSIMFSGKRSRTLVSRVLVLVLVLVVAAFAGAEARAALVTYSWVTDSPGLGGVPTAASFQVPLSAVQSGTFGSFDITNIQFSFPGIGPLTFTSGSSIGLDNAAFVDKVTGAPIFKDKDQGLAAIAYQGSLFSNTFLSITFDNNPPGTSKVDDQFNAINGGPGSLGFGHGHWVASIPAVPEPSSVYLLGFGLAGLAWSLRRRA